MLRFGLRTVVLVGGLALERDPAALARFAASEGFGVVGGTRGFGGGGSRGFAAAVVAALTAVTLWTTAAAWSFPGFSDSKACEHLVTTTLRLGGNQPFNGRQEYTPGEPYYDYCGTR